MQPSDIEKQITFLISKTETENQAVAEILKNYYTKENIQNITDIINEYLKKETKNDTDYIILKEAFKKALKAEKIINTAKKIENYSNEDKKTEEYLKNNIISKYIVLTASVIEDSINFLLNTFK